jgi:hypothetical protein
MTIFSKFTVTFSRNIYRSVAVTAWLDKNLLCTGEVGHRQAKGSVAVSRIAVLKDASDIAFTFS